MQSLSVDCGYKYWDPKQVTPSDSVATAFPAPAVASGVKRPDKIFVQAHPDNTGKIVIGKSNVASTGANGGYVLSAGDNANLSSQDYTELYHIATAAGQKLQITYLAGAL